VRIPGRPRIDAGEVGDRWQPLLYVRLFVLAALVGYAVAFVLENRTTVDVHFVFATVRTSLVWLILVALAVGVLGGILVAQLERRRRRRSQKSTEPGDAVVDLGGRDEAEGEP